MSDLTWEQIAAAFASSASQKGGLADRKKIIGAGLPSWYKSGSNLKVEHYKHFTGSKAPYTKKATLTDKGHDGAPTDVWWAWNYLDAWGDPHSFVVGISINYTDWGNDPAGDLSKFMHLGDEVFYPMLGAAPKWTDTVNADTFTTAAKAITDVTTWLGTWKDAVGRWAERTDAPDSSWQGSAAGEFKALLQSFGDELDALQYQLARGNFAADLETLKTELTKAIGGIYSAYFNWYHSDDAWPTLVTYNLLTTVLSKARVTVTMSNQGAPPVVKVTSSYGDPHNQDFFDKIEQEAKRLWSAHIDNTVQWGARTVLDLLDGKFTAANAKYEAGLRKTPLQLPPVEPPAGPGGEDGPKPPPTGEGGPKPPPTGENGPKPPSLSAGGGGPKTDIGGGSGGKLPPNPNGGSLGGGGGGLGGGPGSGAQILDKNGKPVLGADKKPVLLPPGGYIGAGGKLFDANGKPVLDKNGKQVTVPEGSTVAPGAGGGIYGPNAKVPKGSTVREDGTVLGPDGKPVLDAYGNPVVLEKGGSIAADGTLLDAGGKPIADSIQRYRDQQHALDAIGAGGGGTVISRPPSTGSTWTLDPNIFGGLGGGSSGLGSGSGGYGSYGSYGSGDSDGSGGSSTLVPGSYGSVFGGGAGGGGGSGQLPRLVSSGGGMSPKGIENSNGIAPTNKLLAGGEAEAKAAAQKAEALAAEEAAMRGRSVATSGGGTGSGMMPMGGGMGGGMGAQGEKDRQRTTWLSEDEDVWGTDTGAVHGVIGR
ncbi:hypothetical protein ACIGZJ_15430 [Kitasatospora sp. NPDC052868]|uniref:hypothetical protein n=1 Tax=Kitasatospora sp. NPDC052868 TaxID=3364060 RepID=UPI0037CC51C9